MIWLLLLVLFSMVPNVFLQFALFFALIAWIAVTLKSVWFIFRGWKEHKLKVFIPLVVCIVVFAVSWDLARFGEYLYFEYKLPKFEAVIQGVRTLDIKAGDHRIIPKTGCARFVMAEKLEDGKLQIEFVIGGGFPVKHSGYLYVESGHIDETSFLAERWPKRYEKRNHWFRIRD